MARVYRAYDHRLRRWRAIKLLLPEFAQKSQVRKRFEVEAQALALLEHPHVVRIYDVSGDGAESFIVMELCEGGSVGDWLLEHGVMPQRLAIDVMLAACSGMEAAHAAGIIHRDIKPANLLVDKRGAVKITDFGIAQTEQHSMTRSGLAMGTIGYMAPEQSESARDVDHRADIYALGATLYTLLTGNTDPHLFAIDREPERLADVPQVFRPIIGRAVAFSVADRYPDAALLRAELEAVQSALPPVDPAGPSLLWREVVVIEPPPEPLSAPPTKGASTEVGPRATVQDTVVPSLPTLDGYTKDESEEGFEVPDDAPDPFLAMTPGVVSRVGRPVGTGLKGRSRFDDLYVAEESDSNSSGESKYVDTMVGWKPSRKRVQRAAEMAEEASARRVTAEVESVGAESSSSAEKGRSALLASRVVLLALMVLVAGLLVAFGAGLSVRRGTEAVEGHRLSYWRQIESFHEKLDLDRFLPQDLAGVGAAQEPLHAATLRYRDAASPIERREAAEALSALMSAEYAVLELQRRLTADQEGRLGPRIRSIQIQRRAVDQAAGDWRAAAASLPGRLAIGAGSATPPPE